MEEETIQLTEGQIEEEYGISPSRIYLPSFTGVSLEGIVNQVERLNSLEKGCENLLKLFLNHTQKEGENLLGQPMRQEDMRSTFKWDNERFMTNSIDKATLLLNKEYLRISETYGEKTEEFGSIKREYEKLQKLTRGNLCDINLRIVVDDLEHYEFLRVLYVVVQKDKIHSFDAMIEESPYLSIDAVEKVNSDEEYVLFRLYVLQHNEEEAKSTISNAGFVLRALDEDANVSAEITMRRRRIEEKYSNAEAGLITFIRIHLIEMFRIMIHVKLLKLFVESVYRYGLPTEYMFFVTKGDRTKVLKQWNTIAKDWPSDRMVYEEEGENDEDDVFFAFSEVDIHSGEEN